MALVKKSQNYSFTKYKQWLKYLGITISYICIFDKSQYKVCITKYPKNS